ncbi:MAG: ABC transporter permease [Proteobacteria bacterium]|nr:ABC transporter permease [Pseudomonadota bacterium]
MILDGVFPSAFDKNHGAVAGLAFLGVVALLALAAPLIFPGDPLDLVAEPLLWPLQSMAHPLGTDRLGRDLAAGLSHGALVSLAIGLAAAAAAICIGTFVGALAGYYGGWTDELLMRLAEAFQTVPSFVLALALVAVLGPASSSVVIAIAVTSWTGTARVVRAEVMSLRERPFVEACRAIGMGDGRIIFSEILPNALSGVIVLGTLIVAGAILVESALSFLGLGDPNRVSWGMMIAGGRGVLRSAWFVSAIPGLAIALTVVALCLLGDGLTDALDPKRRRR